MKHRPTLFDNTANHVFLQFLAGQTPLIGEDGFNRRYKTYFHVWIDCASKRRRNAGNDSSITIPPVILLRGFSDRTTESMLSDKGAAIQIRWGVLLDKIRENRSL